MSERFTVRDSRFCASASCFKSRHGGSLILRQVALWIDRGLSSFCRYQRQFDASVPEGKARGREFLQPEAGLAAGVAQLIMGRKHHQYFRVRSPLFRHCARLRALFGDR
jgi:hypothetical protein